MATARSDAPAAPRRADAERNRRRIVQAAREAFASGDGGAPLDELARRAGVSSATFYRHFPTREDLLHAVSEDWIAELRETAGDLAARDDPREALLEWLRALVGHVVTYEGLAAGLATGMDDPGHPLHDHCEVMHGSMSALLTQAQAAGEIRSDLTAPELGRLIHGVTMALGNQPAPERLDRMLALTIDGLRAG